MKTNKNYCQKCGAEITEKKAKTCSECGAKVSRPIFKKWWFWVIVVLGLSIIGGAMGTGTADDVDDTGNGSQSGQDLHDGLKAVHNNNPPVSNDSEFSITKEKKKCKKISRNTGVIRRSRTCPGH